MDHFIIFPFIDPHPGNLIRTPEGKLALIDFGLMTQITDDQKYGMIEAVSHLVHRDYSAIGEDFVRLDFIPRGIDITPIIPALTKVFDAALAGGGAKSINFQDLAADLAQITFEYPFRIPPYFALIIRAIGVLEGIALVGNKDFAIVDEAYPYISRRLLTDESPRLKAVYFPP
jgi:aarF domain-containing kinase